MTTPLSDEQKEKKSADLKRRITLARSRVKSCKGTLDDKLQLLQAVKQAEASLHDFRLNWFNH